MPEDPLQTPAQEYEYDFRHRQLHRNVNMKWLCRCGHVDSLQMRALASGAVLADEEGASAMRATASSVDSTK